MLKRVLFGLSHRCGLNAAVRRTVRRKLLTLCYHSVLPDRDIRPAHGYRNTVGVEELRGQLEILGRWFAFATPEEVLAAAEGGPLPGPSVLITFDDGHDNLREFAAPLLERMGVPAVFHVATGHVGTGVPLWTEELAWIIAGWRADLFPLPSDGLSAPLPATPEDRAALTRRVGAASKALADAERRAYLARLRAAGWATPQGDEREAFRFLDWTGVRDLHRRGFAIGSHTVDHSILSRTDDATLDRELAQSKRRIEAELHTGCPFIAYPNGGPQDVSPRVFDRARAAGYRVGFTTFGGFDHPHRAPLAIGRICVPGRLPEDVFRGMASGLHQLLGRVTRRAAGTGGRSARPGPDVRTGPASSRRSPAAPPA